MENHMSERKRNQYSCLSTGILFDVTLQKSFAVSASAKKYTGTLLDKSTNKS